jgi:hypothetical protein
VKVYGSEREVPDEVYHRYAQQGAAFHQQREELARAKAEHEARVKDWKERFKADPESVFREVELDPKQWAARKLITDHERAQETPEQRELREAREKLAAIEKEKQEATARAQKEKTEAVAKRQRAELGAAWVGALKEAGVPEGPASWGFVAKMAGYQAEIDEAVLAGEMTPEEAQARISPQLLAKLAVEDMRAEQMVTFGNLRGKSLAAAMGREWLDRAAEAWVEVREAEEAAGRAQAGGGAVATGGQRPAPTGGNGNGQPRNGNGQYISRERAQFLDFIGAKG